jgi:hypothetical protein
MESGAGEREVKKATWRKLSPSCVAASRCVVRRSAIRRISDNRSNSFVLIVTRSVFMSATAVARTRHFYLGQPDICTLGLHDGDAD